MADEAPEVARVVHIPLTHASSVTLEATAAQDGLNETDVVNRGVQIYGYLMAIIRAGGEVYVREGADAEVVRVGFS